MKRSINFELDQLIHKQQHIKFIGHFTKDFKIYVLRKQMVNIFINHCSDGFTNDWIFEIGSLLAY